MHIGMILDTGRPFPPDIRVVKEARSLSSSGFQITILTKRFTDDEPKNESILGDAVDVVRIPIQDWRGKIARLWDHLRLIDRTWIEPVDRFIKTFSPDVLHVHDLLLVPTVLRVAAKYELPVVADFHENMPAAFRAYRSEQALLQKIKSGIYHNYSLMKWHESRSIQKCKRIIVVVPEAAERFKGIPHSKVEVVSNTEDKTTFPFQSEDADPGICSRYENSWVLSYIGGIGPHRGLDTTMRAVASVCRKIPGFRLLIVGASKSQSKDIRVDAERLQIEDYVEIITWQPFDRVNSYVVASNVCLVPHNDFEHTQTTVPHKLFQYMICGKPVLVSDCKPLARIVEKSKAGLVFKANDSQDLSKKIYWMYKNPEMCVHMGLCGQKATLGPYAWRHDAERLVQMYQSFVVEI